MNLGDLCSDLLLIVECLPRDMCNLRLRAAARNRFDEPPSRPERHHLRTRPGLPLRTRPRLRAPPSRLGDLVIVYRRALRGPFDDLAFTVSIAPGDRAYSSSFCSERTRPWRPGLALVGAGVCSFLSDPSFAPSSAAGLDPTPARAPPPASTAPSLPDSPVDVSPSPASGSWCRGGLVFAPRAVGRVAVPISPGPDPAAGRRSFLVPRPHRRPRRRRRRLPRRPVPAGRIGPVVPASDVVSPSFLAGGRRVFTDREEADADVGLLDCRPLNRRSLRSYLGFLASSSLRRLVGSVGRLAMLFLFSISIFDVSSLYF